MKIPKLFIIYKDDLVMFADDEVDRNGENVLGENKEKEVFQRFIVKRKKPLFFNVRWCIKIV